MFKEFKWKNRLLIYAYDNYNKKEFCEIEAFFVKNIEAINQRKLLLIKLNINNINNIKTGLVLIGLDGTEKFHSSNNDLLDNLFNIIDSMPMRITEINKNKKNAII